MIRLAKRRVRHEDDGFTMILVIGMAVVLLALVGLGMTLGVQSLQSSRSHSNFEGSLATAEAGVDSTLATINAAFNSGQATWTTPSPCAVTSLPATFSSDEQERTSVLAALLALPTSCTVTSSTGDYVAVRPSNHQAVYSLAWYPKRGVTGAKRRLIKAEYLFAPYKPSNAVLTQGSLDFSGSVAVTAPNATTSADIHTNTDVTGFNNSLEVEGQLSASGSLPGSCPSKVDGGCAANSAIQGLPTISALTYYKALAVANSATWYDLCPGGAVKRPDPAGLLPCSGTQIGSAPYNGWTYTAGSGTTPDLWVLPRTAGGPFAGTYYVYQGDAQIGDNGNSSTVWPITVLAQAAPTGGTATTCNKLGGNITWKLFNVTPSLPGLQYLADANLTGNANNDAGSGVFLAGDKIDLNTSSATITGSVIASNNCAAQGPNTIQGVTINYDDTLETPLSDIIRTSLWLEYPAGT
jgi:hypothetical protein